MDAINRVACNDGDFMGAFRQNVIRVIGSYRKEQELDEYDEKIKKKHDQMMVLIEENAKVGINNEHFDCKYREIVEEIEMLKEKQKTFRNRRRLAEQHDQHPKDMDNFLQNQPSRMMEFDNDLVRRLIGSIKVESEKNLVIHFQSGIVMEQEKGNK